MKKPDSKPKTPAERQQELRARQKKAGFISHSVWVPSGAGPEINRLAALLRMERGNKK